MENPMSWTNAHKAIAKAMSEHREIVEKQICGLSIVGMIYSELCKQGLLNESEDKPGDDKKWSPEKVLGYIWAQENWSNEDKKSMTQQYQAFINALAGSMLPNASNYFQDKIKETRALFERYGITI